MHKTITIPTILTICLWAIHGSAAEPPPGKSIARPANTTAESDSAKRTQDDKRPSLANRWSGANAEKLVTRMLQQFDKDGDEKLDIDELTSLLTFMRERTANFPAMEKQRPGMRAERQEREVGGDKPQRPESE